VSRLSYTWIVSNNFKFFRIFTVRVTDNFTEKSILTKTENVYQSTQFHTLNLKKLFSEPEKNNEVENSAHFEKYVFFEKNDILQVIHIFRPEISICWR